jgi:hypothetical protein
MGVSFVVNFKWSTHKIRLYFHNGTNGSNKIGERPLTAA